MKWLIGLVDVWIWIVKPCQCRDGYPYCSGSARLDPDITIIVDRDAKVWWLITRVASLRVFEQPGKVKVYWKQRYMDTYTNSIRYYHEMLIFWIYFKSVLQFKKNIFTCDFLNYKIQITSYFYFFSLVHIQNIRELVKVSYLYSILLSLSNF